MSELGKPVEAPPPPGKIEPPRIGTWNHLEASVGARGSGKSTDQCERADELAHEAGGAYIIGHSLGQRLPERFLDGRKIPIVYHQTIANLARGLQRHPEKWHVLAPALPEEGGPPLDKRESADDLIKYVIRLSSSIRKRAWQNANPWKFWRAGTRTLDIPCPPIILVIDEGIAVDAAGKGKRESDKWFLEFVYGLRHHHVAMLYAIQEPTARSWRVIEASTALHVYQLRHEWALQAIRAAGADDVMMERIRNLDIYEHVTILGGAQRKKPPEIPATVEEKVSV